MLHTCTNTLLRGYKQHIHYFSEDNPLLWACLGFGPKLSGWTGQTCGQWPKFRPGTNPTFWATVPSCWLGYLRVLSHLTQGFNFKAHWVGHPIQSVTGLGGPGLALRPKWECGQGLKPKFTHSFWIGLILIKLEPIQSAA